MSSPYGSIRYEITQGFGPTDFTGEPAFRGVPHYHMGIDMAHREGNAHPLIYVTTRQKIYGFGTDTDGAKYVICDDGAGRFHAYWHLFNILCPPVGTWVEPFDKGGAAIGQEGSTGNSTADHLHLEVQEKTPYGKSLHTPNNPIDPTPFLEGGTQVTDIQDFSNCVITVRSSWPTEDEVKDWQKSGLDPYTYVQKHFLPDVIDAQAFDHCVITARGSWPTDEERAAWKESGTSAYEWVQKNILNPIEQAALDAATTELKQQVEMAQSNSLNLQTQLTQAQEALEAIQHAPSTPEEADCQQRADEAVTVALERFEADAESNPWKFVAAWIGKTIGTNKKGSEPTK